MPFREISAPFYWRLVESGRCSSSSDALKKSFENGSKKCTECRFSFKFDNKYTSSKWLSRRQGTKKYREHLTLTHPMSCAQQLFWFSAIFFWLSFIKMILYFFVSFWITKLSPIAFLTKAKDANGSEALTIIIWRSDKSDDDDETWRKKINISCTFVHWTILSHISKFAMFQKYSGQKRMLFALWFEMYSKL